MIIKLITDVDFQKIKKMIKKHRSNVIFTYNLVDKYLKISFIDLIDYNNRTNIEVSIDINYPESSIKTLYFSLNENDKVIDFLLNKEVRLECYKKNLDGMTFKGNDTIYYMDTVIVYDKYGKRIRLDEICFDDKYSMIRK